MARGKKRSDDEIKLANEAYLKKTRRWGNISDYPYNTIAEAAYLLDVTPAEVRRRIRYGELNAYTARDYKRGVLIRNADIEIVRYPPFEPPRYKIRRKKL